MRDCNKTKLLCLCTFVKDKLIFLYSIKKKMFKINIIQPLVNRRDLPGTNEMGAKLYFFVCISKNLKTECLKPRS